MDDIGPWQKVFSLRYRSQSPVTPERFDQLIAGIGEIVEQEIVDEDGDHIFELTLGGIPCMCAVSLMDRDPITECRFSVLTTAPIKPSDMTRAEAIHAMIERCFVDEAGPACRP